ncbi:S1/P1 nuclease [Montanilutibacter psychrotolerans]|uniref:Endonuclease n=1 Tax=Montanilutibacter psychrotolerans TaxID=1327343 RepID=A0A3M8T792_9GAMM|nr:S1/P1 nuclease [Lysobacter psychrotolerans]RNF86512.1 endonuclease [Lysobacter psychrotolerans]
MSATLHLAAAALLLTAAVPALAWGKLGHRLVADLAAQDLRPAARAEVAALLAGEPEPTLAGVASWADELRDNNPQLGRTSSRWHYINLGEHACRYDAAQACRNGDCVVEAIRRQLAILADHARSRDDRRQALKFVVHFVGDIHQPLHAGNASDKGGNEVQVSLPDGTGSNLHSLWDSGMLKASGLDEPAYLRRLDALPLAVAVTRTPLTPDTAGWAEASCRIAAQPGLYPPRAKLSADYMGTWRPVAEEQMRRAGSRLAELLNAALTGPASRRR